ncbi:MAG TPA: hypothetical protein VGH86_09260 [Phenylobacterium sp.]|jgi:predicted acylesterase/phospholipase RssA
MPPAPSSPTYAGDDFLLDAAAAEECDLVMKGGITSGVVYPYAILELAKRYRLRSIGGASAGAIAAGFAAAAEYARRGGDPEGFVRLGLRCAALPEILTDLFQPVPRLRPLLRLGLAATAKSHKIWRVLWSLKWILAIGLFLGAAGYAALVWLQALVLTRSALSLDAIPGLIVALALGAVLYVGVALAHLALKVVPANRFGLCSGLRQPGYRVPALTEWFHASLQEIAFGKAEHLPLTFGDLLGDGSAAYSIDFRAMTTNLSLQRPEVIPRTLLKLLYDPQVWRELFPAHVIDYLDSVSPSVAGSPNLRELPAEKDLPVLVGVRMSLSFPILIQAVPLHLEDFGARVRGELGPGEAPPIVPVWFSDGGITSNFPIHFFDSLLPTRPTFAFSLDDLPDTQRKADRVNLPQDAAEGAFLPIHKVEGLGGFASSILASAKDWQDGMQSVLPGQRQRVVRIRLSKDEGGLNLAMPPSLSAALMTLGQEAGALVRQAFDFDEHKWRRTLVAYEELEVLTRNLRKAWPDYGRWYRGYMANVKSYKDRFSLARRKEIADRLDALAACAKGMDPPLNAEFPRPTGRLRTVPELGRVDPGS